MPNIVLDRKAPSTHDPFLSYVRRSVCDAAAFAELSIPSTSYRCVVYRQHLIDGRGFVLTSRGSVPKRTLGPLEPGKRGRIEGGRLNFWRCAISAVLRYRSGGLAI